MLHALIGRPSEIVINGNNDLAITDAVERFPALGGYSLEDGPPLSDGMERAAGVELSVKKSGHVATKSPTCRKLTVNSIHVFAVGLATKSSVRSTTADTGMSIA